MNDICKHKEIANQIRGKRMLAVDFGLRRVGVAVCDIYHIAITPKKTLQYKDNDFWEKIISLIFAEEVKIIVIGIPYNNTKNGDDIISYDLKEFIHLLSSKIELPIFYQDESYSSKRALKTMLEIGKKKKNRAQKGSIDGIAAAIILQDFIDSHSI